VNKRLLLIIILVLIGGIYFSFTYQRPGDFQDLSPEIFPEEQFEDINITFFNLEKTISWEINSQRLERFEKEGLLVIQPVTINAMDQKEEQLYSVTASKGIYRSASCQLELTGPILLKKDKLELVTGWLKWQQNDNIISGGEGVSFNSPYFRLSGDHFTTKLEIESLTVYGRENEQAFFTWKE